MRVVALDIETIRWKDSPACPDEDWYPKAGLYWPTGQVVCCVVYELGAESSVVLAGPDEKSLLEGLSKTFNEDLRDTSNAKNTSDITKAYGTIKLLTFNGKQFDVPFLIGRYATHGLDFPLPELLHEKPWDVDNHLDLYHQLTRGGRFKMWKGGTTLDAWCTYFGIHVKDESGGRGEKVPEDYEKMLKGEITEEQFYDSVIKHCVADVTKLVALYDRTKNWYEPRRKERFSFD